MASIGINFYPTFLDQDYLDKLNALNKDIFNTLNKPAQVPPEKLDELAAKRLRLAEDLGIPAPSFERILDHIDHVVKLVGVNHVGIGSDLDVIATPQGITDVSDLPKINQGLLARGYGEEDIRKI